MPHLSPGFLPSLPLTRPHATPRRAALCRPGLAPRPSLAPPSLRFHPCTISLSLGGADEDDAPPPIQAVDIPAATANKKRKRDAASAATGSNAEVTPHDDAAMLVSLDLDGADAAAEQDTDTLPQTKGEGENDDTPPSTEGREAEQADEAKPPAAAPIEAVIETDPKSIIPVPIDDMESGPEADADADTEADINAKTDADPVSPSAAPDAKSSPTSIKLEMTDEDKAKAQKARQAAEDSADKEADSIAERNMKIRSNVEKVLLFLGEKSRVYQLGNKARASAETFVESTISKGAVENVSQPDKVKAAAATAAKSLVAALVTIWEARAVPYIRDTLPDEFADVSSRFVASASVGIVATIFLLPSLLGGGGEKPKPQSAKKLDSDTSALEKKLARQSNTISSRSTASKSVFPPDELPSKAPSAATTRPPLPSRPTPPPPTPPIPPKVTPVVPPTPVVVPPVAQTVPAAPKVQSPPEPLKPTEVTPDMALTAVSKKLGVNRNLVLSASFDSLYAEPTVALQVTKSFHNLPTTERRRIAELSLQACRTLGYERVTFTEEGSGRQVAQAGIDVDLEDETANLRADVSSMRAMSDKLAIKVTNDEIEIDSLRARLDEQRDDFGIKVREVENAMTALRNENIALSDDLGDAREEIARIPDRLELEKRTLEAEDSSRKMGDTVEMLSKQLAHAREEEATAQQSQADAIARADKALVDKNTALEAEEGRISRASQAADTKAADAIKEARDDAAATVAAAEVKVKGLEERLQTVEREKESKIIEGISAAEGQMRASVTAAETKTKEAQERLATAQKESVAKLQESSDGYEKQLSEERSGREKEVGTIQKKYETMLDDLQRKMTSDLDGAQKASEQRIAALTKEMKMSNDADGKEAKATQNALTKERDEARKETEKVEARAEKEEALAIKQRETLEKKIEKLQEKLKGETEAAKPVSVMRSAKESGTGSGKKFGVVEESSQSAQDLVAKAQAAMEVAKNGAGSDSTEAKVEVKAEDGEKAVGRGGFGGRLGGLSSKLFGGERGERG